MMPPLESDLMRGFLAVAEAGSVTRAADQLGRTQSAVSMLLRRLEETLGQTLFLRGQRGVTLTSRGQQLLPYARRVVGLLEEAGHALRVQPLTGPVRVGIPEEYVHSILPAALTAFAACHPETEVTLRCDFSAPQMVAMAADLIDLAVTFESQSRDDAEVLCIDPTVWVTATGHDQHLRDPLPVAIFFNSDWCRDYALRSLDLAGRRYRAAFECDTSGGMRAAVINGFAVAPLARSTVPPGCRALTPEDGFPPIDAARVVLHRNPRIASPVIDAMATTLREAFSPLAALGAFL